MGLETQCKRPPAAWGQGGDNRGLSPPSHSHGCTLGVSLPLGSRVPLTALGRASCHPPVPPPQPGHPGEFGRWLGKGTPNTPHPQRGAPMGAAYLPQPQQPRHPATGPLPSPRHPVPHGGGHWGGHSRWGQQGAAVTPMAPVPGPAPLPAGLRSGRAAAGPSRWAELAFFGVVVTPAAATASPTTHHPAKTRPSEQESHGDRHRDTRGNVPHN